MVFFDNRKRKEKTFTYNSAIAASILETQRVVKWSTGRDDHLVWPLLFGHGLCFTSLLRPNHVVTRLGFPRPQQPEQVTLTCRDMLRLAVPFLSRPGFDDADVAQAGRTHDAHAHERAQGNERPHDGHLPTLVGQVVVDRAHDRQRDCATQGGGDAHQRDNTGNVVGEKADGMKRSRHEPQARTDTTKRNHPQDAGDVARRHGPSDHPDADSFDDRSEEQWQESTARPDVTEQHGRVHAYRDTGDVVEELGPGFRGRVAEDEGVVQIDVVQNLAQNIFSTLCKVEFRADIRTLYIAAPVEKLI